MSARTDKLRAALCALENEAELPRRDDDRATGEVLGSILAVTLQVITRDAGPLNVVSMLGETLQEYARAIGPDAFARAMRVAGVPAYLVGRAGGRPS